MDIHRIIESWKLSSSLHEFKVGATEEKLASFEKSVGWMLPVEWRQLYAFSDGAYLLQNNLNLDPLMGDELSLEKSSGRLRGCDWPVPQQLWVAGGDGQGGLWGLWLTAADQEKAPVVAIGEIFEPGTLAVAGSTLEKFLLLRTAFYLNLCKAPAAALDVLGVPAKLRSHDPDWEALARWADPQRPGKTDDPYVALLAAPSVEKLLVKPRKSPLQ